MDIPNTYLFTAHYADGTNYEQGELDLSMQDESRNALYDILHEPLKPVEELVAFSLTAVDGAEIPADCPRVLAVNLKTGEFAADDRCFFLHNDLIDNGPLTDFRVLFFRNPWPFLTTVTDNKTGEVVERTTGYSLGYILGWQANNKDGENIKRFISIHGTRKIA